MLLPRLVPPFTHPCAMLPAFDRVILEGLNQYVHQSALFDTFIDFLSYNNLLKGALFTVVLWWTWFKCGNTPSGNACRSIVIGVLAGCFIGMAVTRTLTHIFPERPRPLHNTELQLEPVHAQLLADSADNSSFPSDHATIFFALATGMLFLSRPIGVASLLYVVFFICAPRLYLGLHYPTDLVAGGIIGVATGVASNLPAVRQRYWLPVVQWHYKHQSAFYVGFFLMSYQLDELFAGVRQLMHFVANAL